MKWTYFYELLTCIDGVQRAGPGCLQGMSRWCCEWSRHCVGSALEEKFGFDTKHVGHVFRLLIQGEQILQEGTLDVKLRPADKEFVLAIKEGKYNYDQVLAMAEKKMEGFEDLYKTSKLPHSPDFNKANNLLISIIEDFHYPKAHKLNVF